MYARERMASLRIFDCIYSSSANFARFPVPVVYEEFHAKHAKFAKEEILRKTRKIRPSSRALLYVKRLSKLEVWAVFRRKPYVTQSI